MIQIIGQKNCLFGATNIVKNSDKVKYVYSGYGIAFDGKCKCNFGNDLAKNLVLTILKMIFYYQVNIQLLVLMEDLVHQKKN